jgi:hypothetical protein
MLIGHSAVALAAKKPAPEIGLGTLLLAANWLDLIWPVFLILGIEQVGVLADHPAMAPLDFAYYPFSHSLLFAVLWSLIFASVHWMRSRSARNAVLLGLVVLSHWGLDLVVHLPDLPLAPGGMKVGLGLWRSTAASVALELALFAAGILIYLRATRARDGIGRWSFWGLAAVLLAVYLANVLGPAPSSTAGLGWIALAFWLVPLWGWWIGRHRRAALPGE